MGCFDSADGLLREPSPSAQQDRRVGNYEPRHARSIMGSVPMLPFKLVYSNGYYLPIGAHVFPAEKYRLVHDHLLAGGVAEATDFLEPEPAADQDILLVHTPEYVHKLKTGTLSPREEMELEIPYTPQLVKAFWLAAGGSILAARPALTDRIAI